MNELELRMFQQTWAGIEKYAAEPRPQWVHDVTKLINEKKFAEAQALAKIHSPTATKMYKIKPLGVGLDAVAHLMVGNIPRAKEQPGIFAAKLMGDSKYGKFKGFNTKKMLEDRAAVDKNLGSKGAKSYGRFLGKDGRGGVEFQEFMPNTARGPEVHKLRTKAQFSPRSIFWPARQFWDLHEGNIRADAKGSPKIIDARFDRPGRPDGFRFTGSTKVMKARVAAGLGTMGPFNKLISPHRKADAAAGLRALKDLRAGNAVTIKAPGFFADALRSPAYITGALAATAIGGNALYNHLQKKKRRKQRAAQRLQIR